MSTVLSELCYLPPIEFFAHYAKADTILFEANEHYQKGSYRNRAQIIGANGVQRLSIPLVKGKNRHQAIKDVALAFYEPWPKQHWKTIRSAYGNAPFFFYYSDTFDAVYQEKHTHLWSFNLSLLHCIFELLQWDKNIIETDTYQKNVPDSILDIRNIIAPKNSFPNPNSQTEFSKNKGQTNIPSSIFQTPIYPQVFTERHGFIANLSILDLLFCMGPQSGLYLQEIFPSK